ncbi:MAG: cytochrome c [Bacteroidota bacterium]
MRNCLRSIYFFILLNIFSCTPDKKEVTYSGQIAKIIYKHCTPCHRPGSAGSFDLLTYDDVKKKAKNIELVTRSRFMPPYPADPSYSHFRDEKILSEEEINLIAEWVHNNSPLGDSSKLPPLPVFADESTIGIPDLVIHMQKSFFIEGNNKDHFMMMGIPYELPKDTFIHTIEIVPGNKKLVHHINAHLVQYDTNAKKYFSKSEKVANTELMSKLEAYKILDLPNDDGTYPLLTPSVSNYLPGVETSVYPAGIGGYRVKKNGVLLLDNIHYGPSPVDTTDSTTFNIFFSPTPPGRPTSEFILGTSGISKMEPPLVIAPGKIQTFRTRYTLPEDLSLLTVNPHMHLLGKSFLAYAVNTQGDTIPIIRILKWDFRWQYFYTFNKILKLEKGTTIFVEGVYDNTENNPLNPFNPPQVVSEREGSMRTTDEMMQFIVTYMPYQTGDESIDLTKKE